MDLSKKKLSTKMVGGLRLGVQWERLGHCIPNGSEDLEKRLCGGNFFLFPSKVWMSRDELWIRS